MCRQQRYKDRQSISFMYTKPPGLEAALAKEAAQTAAKVRPRVGRAGRVTQRVWLWELRAVWQWAMTLQRQDGSFCITDIHMFVSRMHSLRPAFA